MITSFNNDTSVAKLLRYCERTARAFSTTVVARIENGLIPVGTEPNARYRFPLRTWIVNVIAIFRQLRRLPTSWRLG
jgi:hypothetical protein